MGEWNVAWVCAQPVTQAKLRGFANDCPMGTEGGSSNGFVTSLYFSSSASWSLFAFARRFWNQIFTWVSVRLSDEENSARSAIERYCFWRNFLSSASNCVVVKGVRGLRFVLCLRSWHLDGLSCERNPITEISKEDEKLSQITKLLKDVWITLISSMKQFLIHKIDGKIFGLYCPCVRIYMCI